MAQATLNAHLADDGGVPCTCGFEYGRTFPLANIVTCPGTYVTCNNFSATITGLIPFTLYYFRAWATNAAGTTYGAYLTFTTNPALYCSVATLPATVITEGSAQLNGMVERDNGSPGDVSFEWGPTKDYGQQTAWLSGYAAGATFLSVIVPLAPGTAYHFRARFRNKYGVFYGKDAGFGTLEAEAIAAMIDDAALLRFLEVA